MYPSGKWGASGLNVPSTIRIHKLTTLSKNEIVRHLGELSALDLATVGTILRRAFLLER